MKAFIILILILTINQLIFADPGDTMLVDDGPDLEQYCHKIPQMSISQNLKIFLLFIQKMSIVLK